MPDDAFDPKREKLVMETKTIWSPECNGLPAEEKARIAEQLHNDPERTSQIRYTRSHTGFVREITVTQSDLARLRQSHTAAK